MVKQLLGTVLIKYQLMLKSGLHIGGTKEAFEIGGVDNPVIKLPIDLKMDNDWLIPKESPYIPGSSIKGKVRHFLEWTIREPKGKNGEKLTSVEYMFNKAQKEFSNDLKKLKQEAGKPCSCGTCSICKLFGVSDINTLKNLEPDKLPGPPRAAFGDAYLTKESLELLKEQLGERYFTELKMENVINRITSESQNLRTNERVPAGVTFTGEITVNLYGKEDLNLLKILLQGLLMLENSYLGGSGSRGYGRVKFKSVDLLWLGKEYLERGEKKEIVRSENLEEVIKNFDQSIKNKLEKLINSSSEG